MKKIMNWIKNLVCSELTCLFMMASLFAALFVPLFWSYIIVGITIIYAITRITLSVMGKDSNYDYDLVPVAEASEKKDDVKPTEWAYLSKIDGEEYHISIFKDEISRLYRIADLERHTIFPETFEDYDAINEWLSKQTNCVMGLCIYSHSNRDKLEEMEREYEEKMSKPLKARVKDGGYEVELSRDPDDENHFYVIGENGRTLSDYNRDQLEFFDDETDNA